MVGLGLDREVLAHPFSEMAMVTLVTLLDLQHFDHVSRAATFVFFASNLCLAVWGKTPNASTIRPNQQWKFQKAQLNGPPWAANARKFWNLESMTTSWSWSTPSYMSKSRMSIRLTLFQPLNWNIRFTHVLPCRVLGVTVTWRSRTHHSRRGYPCFLTGTWGLPQSNSFEERGE